MFEVSGIEQLVCKDIAARQHLGIHKYGTTVLDNPLTLRQWIKHAYEEALDLAIYLKRIDFELHSQQREQQIDLSGSN